MCFHSSLISLLYLFYGEWNLISFLLPSYASCVSCPLWLPTLPADDCVWIRVYLEPLGLEITKGLFIWARLTGLARLPGWISPWVHMRKFSPVSEMRKGQRSWGRVLAPNLGNKANMDKHKIFYFQASVTLKAVSLQLNGMLMMCKIQQTMQDDAIRTTRIHPAVRPGNRDEVFIW